MDSTLYKTNLTNTGFTNSARRMTWCPVINSRFENIQRFRGLCILWNYISNFFS